MQMLAPHSPTLRPTLDTIQKHFLLQQDLPESVQRPEVRLRDAMEVLKGRDAQQALRSSQLPSPIPIATPISPQFQPKPVESRANLRNNDLHRQIGLANSTTGQPNPLEIVSRERAPAPHNPTIPERESHGPSKLQSAAHISQRGQYPNTESPPIIERENPCPSKLQAATEDTMQLHNKNQTNAHQLKL